MSKYKVEASVVYSGLMVVEADSFEEAEQIVHDSFPSYVLTDEGDEIDFFESSAYAVDSDEDDE